MIGGDRRLRSRRCRNVPRSGAPEPERHLFCSSDARTTDAAVGGPTPCWYGDISPLHVATCISQSLRSVAERVEKSGPAQPTSTTLAPSTSLLPRGHKRFCVPACRHRPHQQHQLRFRGSRALEPGAGAGSLSVYIVLVGKVGKPYTSCRQAGSGKTYFRSNLTQEQARYCTRVTTLSGNFKSFLVAHTINKTERVLTELYDIREKRKTNYKTK